MLDFAKARGYITRKELREVLSLDEPTLKQIESVGSESRVEWGGRLTGS
jgi:hypothetical protein